MSGIDCNNNTTILPPRRLAPAAFHSRTLWQVSTKAKVRSCLLRRLASAPFPSGPCGACCVLTTGPESDESLTHAPRDQDWNHRRLRMLLAWSHVQRSYSKMTSPLAFGLPQFHPRSSLHVWGGGHRAKSHGWVRFAPITGRGVGGASGVATTT